MAKYFATEAAVENALEAMRIHGGYGYSKEFNIERLYRDAPLLVIGEGTNELQRIIIARQLIERNRVSDAAAGWHAHLAVEQYGAGPFGTMQLADLGAEVIKIENPTMAATSAARSDRYFFGAGRQPFLPGVQPQQAQPHARPQARRGPRRAARARRDGRRGVQQPARRPAGQARASPTMQLKAVNPRIVCAHLSAYGRDGSRAAWPGYDYLMQAEAGYLSLTGEPDGPPARFGLSIIDMMTGVYAAIALLGGLVGARATGRGRDIDVSLFDVALHNLDYLAAWYLNGGRAQRPRAALEPSVADAEPAVPHGGRLDLHHVQQGEVLAGAVRQARSPGMWDDPRFATFKARLENRDELTRLLDEALSARDTAAWLLHFAGEVPAAPVYDIAQALTSEFVNAEDRIWPYAHAHGDFRMVAPAFRFPGEVSPRAAAPAFGADTDSVLDELGYGAERIAALRAAGVL